MFVYLGTIYKPEEKNSEEYLVFANKVSFKVKTKNTSKYNYFPRLELKFQEFQEMREW